MARKFTVSLDLNKNELLNARIQNLASDPSSPVVGQIYFNTQAAETRVWDGSQWLAGGSVKFGLSSARPSASKHGVLYCATDTHTLYLDNGSAWIQISVNPQDLIDAINNHNNTTTGVHGVSGDVVGTSDSQTLTNKNLGSGTVLGDDLDANGHKIVQVATPTSNFDATNKKYVDDAFTAAALTFQGVSGETTVDHTGHMITIGLPDDVTVTNSLTAASGHITGNLQVDGDVNINGQLNAINRTEINIQDNTIRLNTGFTGTPVADAGIIVERGTSKDVALTWKESDKQWELTNDGDNYHAIARKYSQTIGDGTATSYPVYHNLGTQDYTIQIYESASPFSQIEADVTHTSNSVATVSFASPPSSNQYRVVVIG